MASPTVTYTFTNATVADADQVNTNFTNIINAMTDTTKDFSIAALTCAGAATLNGNVTIGNASSDDLTITASLASSLAIKTTNSYNFGSSTLGLASIYFGNAGGATTVRVLSASSISSSRAYTMPDAGADANFVMTAGSQTIGGVKTFTSGVDIGSNGTIANIKVGTFTPSFTTYSNIPSAPTVDQHHFMQVGNICMFSGRFSGITLTSTSVDTYLQFTIPVSMAGNFSSQRQVSGHGTLHRNNVNTTSQFWAGATTSTQDVILLCENIQDTASGTSGYWLSYNVMYEIQ